MTLAEQMAMQAYLNPGSVESEPAWGGMGSTGGGSLVAKDQVANSGLGNMISDKYNTFMGQNFGMGNYGGLGNYGTYNGQGLSQDAFNAVQGTEHGGDLQKNGSSNTLGYLSAGIQGAGVLGNMYFAKKNADIQEDFTNWQKGKVAESDARKRQFAKNAGGTY